MRSIASCELCKAMSLILWSVFLAAIWLVVPYPLGLWLFVSCACWHGALHLRWRKSLQPIHEIPGGR